MAGRRHDRIKRLIRGFGCLCLAAGVSGAVAPSALALSPQKSMRLGNTLYEGGHYEDAAAQYQEALNQEPESPLMNYNLGTAQYKMNHYDQARNHLQKALLAEGDSLRQKAYYNLGNASFRLSLQQEPADLQQAVSSMEEAVTFYENAFKIDDKDQDAHYNYEIARRELERLKKKMDEQETEQQKKGGQEKQDQSSESQGQDERQDESQQASDRPSSPRQKDEEREDTPKENQGQSHKREPETQDDRHSDEQERREPNDQFGQDKSGEEESPSSPPQTGQGEAQPPKQRAYFTPEEARMLLNRYQSNEEPQMLFDSVLPPESAAPVEKDW